MVFTRILVFAISALIGYVILKYTRPIVKIVGYNSFAERWFGQGGTYTMWKLIGVFIILAGFFYLTGTFELFPGQEQDLNSQKIRPLE